MNQVVNGIIQGDNIFGTPFRVDLIPKDNKFARPGNFMIAKLTTAHNTGNRAPTATARMHTEYVDNVKSYVSWHITVDDKEIWQELPLNENGWHAGDGTKGIGNRSTIGVEICEYEGINWQKAKENFFKVLLFLKLNVPTLQSPYVVPHQRWMDKYCPRRILDEGWDNFTNEYVTYTTALLEPPKEEKKNWVQIITDCVSEIDAWIAGIQAAVNAAKEDGNMGDLEIFEFLPELFEKIYYAKNKAPGKSHIDIINESTFSASEWLRAINTAINIAKHNSDLGELEIFQFMPDLIVKIYYAN